MPERKPNIPRANLRRRRDPVCDLDEFQTPEKVEHEEECSYCGNRCYTHPKIGYVTYNSLGNPVNVTIHKLCDGEVVEVWPPNVKPPRS